MICPFNPTHEILPPTTAGWIADGIDFGYHLAYNNLIDGFWLSMENTTNSKIDPIFLYEIKPKDDLFFSDQPLPEQTQVGIDYWMNEEYHQHWLSKQAVANFNILPDQLTNQDFFVIKTKAEQYFQTYLLLL